ncbi:MAG: aconitate hydratase AcnA [Rhodothermales bacterium]|nr:aconitate hydratase AcnA [Rhodothermales bacterium]MBO6778197.1 aconitate hydratase AcnA [Rhodothermales bacterium]
MSTPRKEDPFNARDTFDTGSGTGYVYRLDALKERGFDIDRLPYSIKVLLESVLRNCDGFLVTEDDVKRLAAYDPKAPAKEEIPFMPARVLLQDFTGVPAVVDLAAMRSAMARLGGDPDEINPRVPVNLVIDHSVQVDAFGTKAAIQINAEKEFKRNRERYEFLRWGQQAFDNFHVVPPESGICHQVNLEYIARAVWSKPEADGVHVFYPDSLVGTDSHTTMIDGLGVVGWGVGGIEAEAVMLGQPVYMLMPEVVGFRLKGQLPEGATATDLVLTVTEMLRAYGVVGKFVEFFGPGVSNMTVPDRATIANMAPEYGATMGFFPIDQETLDFLHRTGRPDELVMAVERYAKLQGLFRTDDSGDPQFVDVLELDLSTVTPSLSGPKRPQDRIELPAVQSSFRTSLTTPAGPKGFGLNEDRLKDTGAYGDGVLRHGDVAIAAITSCTNTSNPSVMLAAGLVAKKAVERGLKVKPYVKTSLAPGSKVVTEYLHEAGLWPYLDQLGFNLVGYGCTTCIGNSGPLPEETANAVKEGNLIVAGVLSGNRNFEGRIHQLVQANYLASPPLVVAYALAGTVDINLTTDPIGVDSAGNDVFLSDIWPTGSEILEMVNTCVKPEQFISEYDGIEESNESWNAIEIGEGSIYDWNPASTYVQEPPFFMDLTPETPVIEPISGARVLAKVGDSTTTDHISPAGAIAPDSPAARYLLENNVSFLDFNSYGSRRGNHEVMMRGTFANIRIKNQLVPGTEGGVTKYFPTGETMPIYDAAMQYIDGGTPLVVLAGKDYGMGSSRDWAAKGTLLLGVKAVIVDSFERIHRSNLIGMGVLPLQYAGGASAASLGLDGTEAFSIPVTDDVQPRSTITVTAEKADGSTIEFDTVCRLDTPVEVDYYRNGGILHYVLREFLNASRVDA